MSLFELSQRFHGELRAQRAVLMYCRERRAEHFAHGRIVEPCDGNVLRHGNALLREKAQELGGVSIGYGKNRRRTAECLQILPVKRPPLGPLHGDDKLLGASGREAAAKPCHAVAVNTNIVIRKAEGGFVTQRVKILPDLPPAVEIIDGEIQKPPR